MDLGMQSRKKRAVVLLMVAALLLAGALFTLVTSLSKETPSQMLPVAAKAGDYDPFDISEDELSEFLGAHEAGETKFLDDPRASEAALRELLKASEQYAMTVKEQYGFVPRDVARDVAALKQSLASVQEGQAAEKSRSTFSLVLVLLLLTGAAVFAAVGAKHLKETKMNAPDHDR